MRPKALNQPRSRSNSRRAAAASGRLQYSLFDPRLVVPRGDAEHFRRQAELCQRLLGAVHQPDLVDVLGRLHEEYEETATRIESGVSQTK
jgi:hypothetical protein